MAPNYLESIRHVLKTWAKLAVEDFEAKAVYLFGSLIYKDGAQFMDGSDIDLVVVMPELAGAVDRWRWLRRFSEAVTGLEFKLMRELRRPATQPMVSIVAVTETELVFDLHKDGHRQFFTSNTFRDLVTSTDSEGLPNAGSSETDRFVAGALSVAQKIRNDFLAVSANGTHRLTDHGGDDPAPKRIMRAAAMAARATGGTEGPGAEHDVKEGLDLLTHELYERRDDDPAYRHLQDLMSVRRQARGELRPVDAAQQLLLGEMVYELALRTEPSGVIEAGILEGRPTAAEDLEAAAPVEALAKDAAAVEPGRAAEAPERMGSSTSFFAERFAGAFPGVRSISWFSESDDIAQRMLALLRSPLAFQDGLPVWYWRGGNLQIEDFRQLSPSLFLMDADELKIARIAAIPGSSYKRHFVYVRCDAMEPTGLYRTRTKDIAAALEQMGYDYEEYGLVSGTIPVARAAYDDGAAMIDGKLTDLRGKSELRIRYTTPYNFVIAANGSPINNPRFDDTLVELLNEALAQPESETVVVQRLRDLVEKLPLRGGSH